ncbi:MAG: hypothetical protein E7559_00135 [Ruminococcaceae bacterium]|nr:hypothetical protein [Oscillospiraceae bacterium]
MVTSRFIGLMLLPGFVFRLLGRRDGKHSPKTVPLRMSGFEERCSMLINCEMLLSEKRTRDAVQQTVDALFLFKVSNAGEPAANTIRRRLQAASALGDALKQTRRERRRLTSVADTIFRKYKSIAAQYLVGVSRFTEDAPTLSESSYFSAEEYLCEAECERLFGFIEKSASALLNVPEVSVKGYERSA